MTNPSSALEAAARFLGPEYVVKYGEIRYNNARWINDGELLDALLRRAAERNL